MLLKLICEPRTQLQLNLQFDDGTSKSVDVAEGMYGTFVYMCHGISTEITGRVVGTSTNTGKGDVYTGPLKKPGYMCDPNYVNSGFVNKRPFPVHGHMHSCTCTPPAAQPTTPDVRNYITVEGVGEYCGKTVQIDVYSIIDVFTVFQDTVSVATPDTSSGVKMLRVNNGQLQYTSDGITWVDVTIDTSVITAMQDQITQFQSDLDLIGTKTNEHCMTLKAHDTVLEGMDDDVALAVAKANEATAMKEMVEVKFNQYDQKFAEMQATIDELKTEVAALKAASAG